MSTKLTLSINKVVIEKAKHYAKANGQSLSQIIESYLDKITRDNIETGDGDLDNIRGIISLPEDFDVKAEAKKIRISKHS